MEQPSNNNSNELSEMVMGQMSDAQFAQTLDVLLDMENPLVDMGNNSRSGGSSPTGSNNNNNNLQTSATSVSAGVAAAAAASSGANTRMNPPQPVAGAPNNNGLNVSSITLALNLPAGSLSQQPQQQQQVLPTPAIASLPGGGGGPIQRPLIAAAQQQPTQTPRSLQIPSVFPASFLMPVLPSVPFGAAIAPVPPNNNGGAATTAQAASAGAPSSLAVALGGGGGTAQKPPPPASVPRAALVKGGGGGMTRKRSSATSASSSAASVVGGVPTTTTTAAATAAYTTAPVSEDEGERIRRRQDRNLREQLRSQQITDQIKHLRQVLVDANIKFKSDKYSTLVTVAAYIKQLQDRSALLDDEHHKLLQTIIKSTELVNNQYLPAVADSSMEGPFSKDDLFNEQQLLQPDSARSSASPPLDETMVFVNGIDYKSIFKGCPFACSIASIDGRFVDCNKEFEDMSGFTRQELLRTPSPAGSSPTSGTSPPVVATTISSTATATLGTATGASTSTSSISSSSDGGGGGGGGGSSSPSPPSETTSSLALGGRTMSLFNVVQRDDMGRIFAAMSEMLKAPQVQQQDEQQQDADFHPGDSRVESVELCRNKDQPARLSINLVRTTEGRPRFFNCLLLPA